jgi:calcineurin-like phosphoesterase family protein
MNNIYFSSDWHLGHKNIIKYAQRPFTTIEDMNILIFNLVKKLPINSYLYFLGDLGFTTEILDYFFYEVLSPDIRFVWILGNHDFKFESNMDKYINYCYDIKEYKSIKIDNQDIFLCHYPMVTWNKSHFNSWLLYGHHHICANGTEKVFEKMQGKTLNVNLEFHDYKIWSFEEIKEYMNDKPNNWDYIEKGNLR